MMLGQSRLQYPGRMILMKKLIALALAAMMLLTLAACGEQNAPETQVPTAAPTAEPTVAPTDTPETEAPTEEPEKVITSLDMAETVLVDNENCTFAVSLAEENAHLGMTMDALCVNKTDKTLFFTWNSVSVCGYMYDPLWSEEVAPGETVNSTVYIDTWQLEQYGITSVDESQFTLYIFDGADFMAEPVVNEVFHIYPTGLIADSFTSLQRAAVKGEQVIVDNEDACFIIEPMDEDADSYILRCYLANKTDRVLLYVWEDVQVNGIAMDPLWSAQVDAGKQAYAQITFDRVALERVGVELPEEITFRLTAMDSEDWEAEPVLDGEYTYQAISG